MNEVIRRADPCSDYELLQRVGSGSYGEVYKARNLRSGEFAAVKMVKLETGDNFVAIQQEILMLKDCIHPNIISYYGSYLKRDRLWIVMQYCSGGSLQDIYQMIGPLTELQIAFVSRETLKGLQYLHHRGKVHRDVKGANILLTHTGDIKLADFGIAAQITATLGKRLSFIGTPYWMAPEVANVENSGGYGSECDIWALGITAIELAELKPPYYDLQPMQVLYLMTKSNYKVPKLKDKKKWSLTFMNFVKSCLTKNPKKRPSPEKLLATNPFVSGALSSRLTRELLDRVNHPERIKQLGEEIKRNDPVSRNSHYADRIFVESESEPESDSNSVHLNFVIPNQLYYPHQSDEQRIVDFNASSPINHSVQYSLPISTIKCVHSENEDEVFDIINDHKDGRNDQSNIEKSYHSERTLLASQSSQEETINQNNINHTIKNQSNNNAIEEDELVEKQISGKSPLLRTRPQDFRISTSRIAISRPISCTSDRKNRTPGSKANRLLARIDESFRQHWHRMRSKSTSMVNVNLYASGPLGVSNYNNLNNSHHSHHPFQSRPLTCCFGMVPTPQVTMGACFITVLHRTSIHVHCCTQWFHPANHKQFMIIGAEQGIYAMDLNDMSIEDEAPLIQLHERRCTWLYVVDDTVTALQGKTPYLYRHDLLQLFQQELITQKLVKSLDKLPEKLKPKAFVSSLRMPETKNCYQCNVEQSINDGSLYLCCAVPNAVLLFRWYDPLSRFIWLKRVELDKLALPYLGPQRPHRPFNLIFGSAASNSDYPMVCIGISRALTSPVGTAQQLLHELRYKPQKDKLELQFINFNETCEKFHKLLSSGMFDAIGSSDEEDIASIGDPIRIGIARSPSLKGSLRTIWRWREKLENVVALKQLDRDTLFIAYGNQIIITDLNGNEKKTDLMVTAFSFDFRLEYAIPLSDSVLAFHKHGVQAKSFFRGITTQDLNDPSRQYQLIGKDLLVVLKTTKTHCSLDDSLITDAVHIDKQHEEEDICVLTGHVSTMTPP